jgi:hypothetical protein
MYALLINCSKLRELFGIINCKCAGFVQAIKLTMHAQGLNLRYLGHVRRVLLSGAGAEAAPSAAKLALASDLLSEALARTIKWELWAAMRRGHCAADALAVCDLLDGMPHVHLRIAQRWNKLLYKNAKWSGGNRSPFGDSVSVPWLELKLRSRFPGALLPSEHLPLFDSRASYTATPAAATGAATNVLVDLAVVVPRAFALAGVVLTFDGMTALAAGDRMQESYVTKVCSRTTCRECACARRPGLPQACRSG